MNQPQRVLIIRTERDKSVAPPLQDVWVKISSLDLTNGEVPGVWGFTHSAQVVLPFLVDLPAQTAGNFTELAIDLDAPIFPRQPKCEYVVELRLRNDIIDKKTFRNFTQRHQFILSTQLLFEESNDIMLSVMAIFGGAEVPRFFVRVFYV